MLVTSLALREMTEVITSLRTTVNLEQCNYDRLSLQNIMKKFANAAVSIY